MLFKEPSGHASQEGNWEAWPLIVPKGVDQDGVWIPSNFQDTVVLHVVKNYTSGLNPPLLLAIQGRKGEGKSFQTREVCSLMGVYVVPVSGALLSGEFEGAPLKVLKEAYIYASAVREKTERMTALLIDDFDLSVASTFNDRRYTVNSQLLVGFLMNLADDPARCDKNKTFRIPIIVTGNNFQAVHSPLTRHGRMNFFEWEPTLEQKVGIVRAMFAPVFAESRIDNKVSRLVKKHCEQPISFFAALKEDMVDEAILRTIQNDGRIHIPSIQRAAVQALQGQTVEILFGLADRRAKSQASNYLWSDTG